MQKGRLQLQTSQLLQSELAAAMATKEDQTVPRAREFKDLEASNSYWSGPETKSQR